MTQDIKHYNLDQLGAVNAQATKLVSAIQHRTALLRMQELQAAETAGADGANNRLMRKAYGFSRRQFQGYKKDVKKEEVKHQRGAKAPTLVKRRRSPRVDEGEL